MNPDSWSVEIHTPVKPKCMNVLFELKSTSYLRNDVKMLQPKRQTTTYGHRKISYTGAKLWNDLSPLLSNVGELNLLKSALTLLTKDYLDHPFTYM